MSRCFKNNAPDAFVDVAKFRFDRIVSASALQWAKDLDTTLAAIAALNTPVSLAIFTSNTFKTLYETAGLSPILRHSDEVTALLEKHFDGGLEILHYTLTFDCQRDVPIYEKKRSWCRKKCVKL